MTDYDALDWSPCHECGHRMAIDIGVFESSGGDTVLVYCPSCGGEPVTNPDAIAAQCHEMANADFDITSAVADATPSTPARDQLTRFNEAAETVTFWCMVSGAVFILSAVALTLLGVV